MASLSKKHFLWLATLFFIVLALYGYYDVTTSNQGGVVGADRSMVHIMVFTLMALEGIYILFHRVKNTGFGYLSLPLVVTGIWMICSGIYNSITPSMVYLYLVFIVWWILTLKFFSVYTFVNGSSNRQLITLFIGMFIVWVFLNVIAREAIAMASNRYGITMFVYYVLILMPFIFYIKRSIIRNIFIAVACLAVVLSLKRGAILTLPVMIFAYYATKYKMEKHLMRIVWPTIIGAVLIGGLLVFIDSSTDGLLFSRFSEDQMQSGSGRDVLREMALADISRRDTMLFLFGRGSGSTVQFLGTGAHNEWIEALFTYGLIGVLIYFWMFFRCAKYAFRLLHNKNQNAPIAMMWVAYLFMCSMFSGFLYMHVAFYFWAGLGFTIGYSDYQRIKGCA
jgi:hypothetical protein